MNTTAQPIEHRAPLALVWVLMGIGLVIGAILAWLDYDPQHNDPLRHAAEYVVPITLSFGMVALCLNYQRVSISADGSTLSFRGIRTGYLERKVALRHIRSIAYLDALEQRRSMTSTLVLESVTPERVRSFRLMDHMTTGARSALVRDVVMATLAANAGVILDPALSARYRPL